jgi:hypothetical protein
MTAAWGFSVVRAMRLLMLALEGLIVVFLFVRLLAYLREPAWHSIESRVLGVLSNSVIYAFPLLVLLQISSLVFTSNRRFALHGLARSLSYVVAAIAIVFLFGGNIE